MLLPNQEFLHALQRLFESRRESGSVFLTHKRLTYMAPLTSTTSMTNTQGEDDVEMTNDTANNQAGHARESTREDGDEREWPYLVRATDGKGKKAKTKISTVVEPTDYDSFSTLFGALLKQSMTSMRKKRKHLIQQKRKQQAASKQQQKQQQQQQQQSDKRQSSSTVGGAGGTATATFKPSLTKVIGPRRGAGVEKRRALKRRRERELRQQRARRKRERQQQAASNTSSK
ncbi:hypothetical protein OIV83_001609 [Microbotryomycetes sp. JL201]|nr:hypothetical protein OIV83_001609 [Microbotryomycetes sp. JL201]